MSRALLVLLLAGCGRPRALYVDQVEAGQALLIEERTGRRLRVSARALGDAGEGSWLGQPEATRLRATTLRRARLGHGDDGRDLQLGE